MGAADVVLQLAILALTLLIVFIALHYLPSPRQPKEDRTHATILAHTDRHLAQAAHLLARAHPNRGHFAKLALAEADAALSLSPKDPSPLILKSLALHHLGHKAPALRALDLALSPPRARSLSSEERVQALTRRAELKLEVNARRRLDSALQDLTEAARLTGGEGAVKAYCLLGRCYEWKGMSEEARLAFERAQKAQPDCLEACEGLRRLGF